VVQDCTSHISPSHRRRRGAKSRRCWPSSSSGAAFFPSAISLFAIEAERPPIASPASSARTTTLTSSSETSATQQNGHEHAETRVRPCTRPCINSDGQGSSRPPKCEHRRRRTSPHCPLTLYRALVAGIAYPGEPTHRRLDYVSRRPNLDAHKYPNLQYSNQSGHYVLVLLSHTWFFFFFAKPTFVSHQMF
jgi:hypothetical protein